jgi:hypothetical protein
MANNSSTTIVERIVIPHTAFAEAEQQIERCFTFSADKSDAEGLAIVGESGTGKTSVLKSFQSKHLPTRSSDGMEVPILCASVPSTPTVKSLAGVMLEALGATDCERGTENEKSRRLRILMKNTGTRMVMIDEFQHFYDRGTRKIMHHVADWLKLLIDDTRTTLVVAGLPSCRVVIDQNEQLARRFLAPVQLSRFSWRNLEQRGQFIAILKAFHKAIAKEYDVPQFFSEQMAFRFYLATGGLIGYLSKLLRQALRNATAENRSAISLGDLDVAHRQAIWANETLPGLPRPFDHGFQLVEDADMLDRVGKIGTTTALPEVPRMRKSRQQRESINSSLVAR